MHDPLLVVLIIDADDYDNGLSIISIKDDAEMWDFDNFDDTDHIIIILMLVKIKWWVCCS